MCVCVCDGRDAKPCHHTHTFAHFPWKEAKERRLKEVTCISSVDYAFATRPAINVQLEGIAIELKAE